MQRKHSKEMAVRWLIILVLTLCLPLLPPVSSAPASPLAAVAEQVVIVEEPTLTPAFGPICTTGWHGFDNNRGHVAYLTLNTNDPGQSTNSGRWTPSLPQAGSWRVEAFIPNHSAMTWPCTGQYISWDTSDARYTIHSSGGVHTVPGNQSPFFDGWLDLGAYDFAAGSGGYVELVDLNGETNISHFVSFSAMRFTWESSGGEGSSITTVEEPTTLHPGYTGDTCTCGWYRLDTDRGHYAYLTLNTNDPGQSTNWAQWRPTLAEAGDYRVEAYIPNHSPFTWPCTGQYISWDTSDARYKIYHAAGMTEPPGNQSPLANQWLDLGVFHFNAGTNGYVELADLNGEENLSHFVSFSAVRFTKQSGGSSVETLILINRARIAKQYDDAAATQIMNKLAQLAAHNSVRGIVVQVESTPAVAAAYSAWNQHLDEPDYANSVTEAIHGLIDVQVAAHPEIKYLVLVGDDRIIPMRREPNEAYDCAEPGCGGWETGYLDVTCSSTVGSALCHEQNLSDNYFGDKVIETWALHQPYVPDLAVGRLIENPTEIVTQIDLFLASDGRVPTRAGVVGADHARDGARAARDEWQGKGLPVDVLISNSWTRAQFIDQFLDQSHDLVGLYHHANHYQIVSGICTLNLTT